MIVSGNKNYGLASKLAQKWPEAVFWSRSTNQKDLTLPSIQSEFAQQSLDYPIYISCSSLSGFSQTTLLEKVANLWIAHKKSGHIIAVGSVADTTTKGNAKTYAVEKKSLKLYCQQLSLMIQGLNDPPKFKVCYLSLGHLNTPQKIEKHGQVPHLEHTDVIRAIEWILQQPEPLFVSEMTMAAIGLGPTAVESE